MNLIHDGWFSEISEMWPGICLSLKVDKVLYKGRSNYQDIAILETQNHGKALILDGVIQCTEYDEFSYQEMIAYVPLCSHPNPKSVLIVGGGDGGVAREVAKYDSVESIVQIEIDDQVIDLCKKYLPSMSQGLLNPKVSLHIGDGFEFMKNHKNQFDVIITDSSDPVGPANALFQESYFGLMKGALKKGGIVCSQAGSVWVKNDIVENTLKHCRSVFPVTDYSTVIVPTYPSGQIGFVLGSLNSETNFREPLKLFSEEELENMKFKYYNDKLHRASFVLPRFAEKSLKS